MTTTTAWSKLNAHYEKMKGAQMRKLFAADTSRFEKFSATFESILLDYSKASPPTLRERTAHPHPPAHLAPHPTAARRTSSTARRSRR